MMKSTKKCPLFSTISLAADGDEVAIEKILNHYDAYISKASLRPFYDEYKMSRPNVQKILYKNVQLVCLS